MNISELFLDKIALAYRCECEAAEAIKENIVYLKNESVLNIHQRGMDFQGRRFKFNYIVNVGSLQHEQVLIMCCPITSGTPQFVIEFNPNNFSSTGMNQLWESLEIILGDVYFEGFVEEALVTRLDIAFDVEGISPNSVEVRGQRLHLGDRRTGDKGKTTSFYIGSRRSDLHFCIYDRSELPNAAVPPDTAITRVEARIKPRLPLSGLRGIENPFNRLTIINSITNNQLNQFPTRYRLFWGAIQFNGLQGAGSLITRYETRRDYLAFIEEELSPDWYDPLSLWCSYPRALRRLNLDRVGIHVPRRRRRRANH